MRTLVAILLAAGMAACGQGEPSGTRILAVDQAGFRVDFPAGWYAEAADRFRWPGRQTVAYLSNRPMDPACSADEGEPSCSAPVAALQDGALLIWWLTTNCAGPACDPRGDERLLIGGREAVRAPNSYGFCDSLNATGEDDYLVAVSPQRVDLIVVCQRDAEESVVAQMRSVLERVDWRTP